jgi:uncharacterized protein
VSPALAGLLYRRRRVLVAFVLIGAVVLAPRANITHIDNDLTAWFSGQDAVYQQYEHFREIFGGTRTLIIAIEAPSPDRLCSKDGLEFLEAITSDLERIAPVTRVSSLATATVVDAENANERERVSPRERSGDRGAPASEREGGSAGAEPPGSINVRPLFDDLRTSSPAAVCRRAQEDELLRGDLLSEDGTVAAVIVFFDESRVDEIRAAVLDRIRDAVSAKLPRDFRALYNGSLEISETYNRITLDNQTKFTPPIGVLTLVAIYGMFRSWRKTLLTAGAVLVSAIWTLGLYDLMGFTYNVLSSMILPLIVVLAIADDVHIIQHYDEERRRGSAEQAFRSTVSHLTAPLLGASGTTALGMLSLATSSVVAVREFGIGSAVGIMVDFVISLILMPAALGWLRPEPAVAPQERFFRGPMMWIANLSTRRAGTVLAISAAITVIAGAGLARLRVDTNHMNFFSSRHPLGQAATVIDGKLAGVYTFQILFEGPPDSMRRPDIVKRMAGLEDELRKLPFVRKVTGLPDYLSRIHRELAPPPAQARLPDDASTIAQELFVFSLADAGRVELEQIAVSDFSAAQVTVKLASMSSDLVFAQIQTAERLTETAFAGTDIRPIVTGSGRLFSALDHYLVVSQISSFATAFVTVFGVIFLIFRSWRFGLLAVIPNLFPVLAIFGVMGWLDITLNVATIMLASVALGVVDDDTIHFISRYRRETAAGVSTTDAIQIATAHEGRASLTTALINSCAFGVLALSEYRPTAWFGGMLALTMLVAFLAEVFILPAMIVLAPRMFGADRVHGARRRASAAGGGL